MEQTTWGWLIVIYLFLGGLGAGSYLNASLAYKGYFNGREKLGATFHKIGFWVAPIAVMIGTVLLVFDLAPSAAFNPLMLIQLFSRPVSMMSVGVYLLSLFVVVSIVTLVLVAKKKTLNDGLLLFGSVLAFGVMCYTGLLLYVVSAIPLWATLWLPALFTLSAFSTGMSINALPVLFGGSHLTRKTYGIHSIVIALEVVSLAFLSVHALGSAAGQASLTKIMFGELAVAFWVGFVVLGLAVPLLSSMKSCFSAAGSKGDAVASEEAHGGKGLAIGSSLALPIAGEVLVLVGGLILRVIVVFGAVSIIL